MGLAELDGRQVAIGGDDFTISGGSPHNVRKHPSQFTQSLAMQYGIPYIQLVEGVGHSSKRDEASGHMGLPSGAPAAFALMSHFTVMVQGQSQIFPSGPLVARRAIGETLDKETREPLPSQPGKPKRYDYEYERNGGYCSTKLWSIRTVQNRTKSLKSNE